MLMSRNTYIVKPERMEEFVEVLKSAFPQDFPYTYRIYVPKIGPHGTVVTEKEYESMEKRERGLDERRASGKLAAIAEKIQPYLEVGGSIYIWRLVD